MLTHLLRLRLSVCIMFMQLARACTRTHARKHTVLVWLHQVNADGLRDLTLWAMLGTYLDVFDVTFAYKLQLLRVPRARCRCCLHATPF